jgi:hypothetical protein
MGTLTLRTFWIKITTRTFLRGISEKKIVTALTPIPKSYFDFNQFLIFVHLILFFAITVAHPLESEI